MYKINSKDINPELRYYKFWLFIGLILIVVVINYSLFTKVPSPTAIARYFSHTEAKSYLGWHSILWVYFDKWSHMLAYFVLTAWFAQLYHVKKQRLFYALSFLIMSATIELIQHLGHTRNFEILDMAANSIGVVIAFTITEVPVCRKILLKLESYI